MGYSGIRFPERTEDLDDYEDYRVFFDHWDELVAGLRKHYETLAVRGSTRVVGIYADQGAGKTMLARKLDGDFTRTQKALSEGSHVADKLNLWHRTVGGLTVDAALVQSATLSGAVHPIGRGTDWVETTGKWVESNQSKQRIIIADNAERGYFLQGLVELSDAEFLQLRGSEGLHQLAAQKFVEHCRDRFRGCLFVLLTNNKTFLSAFAEQVELQHKGLMTQVALPLPSATDKETIVRVNTNRLNEISYWYCLDRAGPEDKVRVQAALRGAATFSDSFSAVDDAIRNSSRTGRPANKNVISLVCLVPDVSLFRSNQVSIGDVESEEVDTDWLLVRLLGSGWTEGALPSERERQFLESEWKLRLVALGDPFVGALLDPSPTTQKACADLLALLEKSFGTGTWQKTRDAHEEAARALVQSWPEHTANVAAFWAAGQSRSKQYEAALKALRPSYDTAQPGFLGYRPDLVVSPFVPCAVTSAAPDDIEAIKAAIKRDCHVLEFTSFQTPTTTAVREYLSTKLSNYVHVTTEQ